MAQAIKKHLNQQKLILQHSSRQAINERPSHESAFGNWSKGRGARESD
jgi:hypothetical protein